MYRVKDTSHNSTAGSRVVIFVRAYCQKPHYHGHLLHANLFRLVLFPDCHAWAKALHGYVNDAQFEIRMHKCNLAVVARGTKIFH